MFDVKRYVAFPAGQGERRATVLGYGLAVVSVGLATGLRMLIDPSVGDSVPFITYFMATALTMRFTGWGPSLLAIVLGAVAGDWFFLPPRHTLWSSPNHLALQGLFVLTNLIIASLGQAMRQARQSAEANARIARERQKETERLLAEREQAQHKLREQAHLAQLRADAIQALQRPGTMRELLQSVAALLVERLDAAFARVWTLDPAGQTLELQASAGLYTHLNGAHGRVPVGQLKIGLIAQERQPHVTNQVIGDPRVPNQSWARQQSLVAFAGFPLLLEGRLLGVVALFARHTLSPAATETFGSVAGALAQALARKQAEAALQAAKEDLARANEDLERKVQERTAKLRELVGELEHFSYTITHDMRAPLRAMQGFANLMLEGGCADCANRLAGDYLKRIMTATGRMDALITDALQYNQVVRTELALEPVAVAPLLQGMIESYPNLQPPQAEIVLEGDFPPVLGNSAALTQCFSNLLGNAVKFVVPGTRPHVRIWAETRDGRVRLWFEDNGIGIPKEYQARIFDMFYRGDVHYEGTGIGLAIVRKAADRMGGRVGVESEPGRGSCFWLELKISEAEAAG